MDEYRCGVTEHVTIAAIGKGPADPNLTYYIEAVPDGVSRSEYRQAWDSWVKVCGIKAIEVPDKSKADIIMSTGRGKRSGFDGESGVLAWAHLGPHHNNQLTMRFDLDEQWNRTILFGPVAEHEIGHLLGLDHSSMRTALLYPTYNRNVPHPTEQDDIPRVQRIYGPPISNPPPGGGGSIPGGFVNRETVGYIIDIALGLLKKRVESTSTKIDDLLFNLAAGQKEFLIDLIMGLFASKGSITAADVQAIVDDPVVIEQLKAA